jgi:hypothetical protein
MKLIIRTLLNLILALLAVGITLLVVFFMMPSWQQAAVERLLEEDRSGAWQVDGVRFSPTTATVDKLFYLGNGIGVELGPAELRLDLLGSLLGSTVKVSGATIEQALIDLSSVNLEGYSEADWAALPQRAATDPEFWETRVQVVLGRLRSQGVYVELENVQWSGGALFPNDIFVQFQWQLVRASNRDALEVEIAPPLL